MVKIRKACWSVLQALRTRIQSRSSSLTLIFKSAFLSKLLSSRDICPLLKDPPALTAVTDLFEEHVREKHQHIDLIAGTGN